MLKMRTILATALMTSSVFADVSFQEKVNRVEYLESLAEKAISMNIDVYRRELQYEKQNLPLEKRAQHEANLLAEKVKNQVQQSYLLAIEEKSPEEATAELKKAIERDLELVAPELQNDIRAIAFKALEDAQSGGISNDTRMESLEKTLLKNVQERSEFLNKEATYELPPSKLETVPQADEMKYTSKAQVLESLVSSEKSNRWSEMANISLRSDKSTKSDSRISFQLKTDFLGVAIDGGPNINFRREYNSSSFVLSETLHPVLLANGHFDFWMRDKNGNIVQKDGKPQRRFLVFTCETNLFFETEYSGGGNFYIAGLGGGQYFNRRYANNVIIASRRVAIPESIDGKTVTFDYLKHLCQDEFINTHITNNMTVKDSLNIMMKNIIASVRFSHPKTTCVVDKQCNKWFNNELIGYIKNLNTPRCVEDPKEKFSTCDVRGLEGQSCPVYDKSGKLLSSGNFEFQCDKGLRCVQTQSAGWFKDFSIYRSAKGQCKR
jgi:hypothetical protein